MPAAVFFGTPDFAVPSVEALMEIAEVRAVVVQPDRPRGRGRAVEPPPVKRRALAAGIRVLQPEKIRVPELAQELRGFGVDVFVVVAYGRILPATLLDIPPKGCVNVHGSILPRHRGAAPIQWSIRAGDRRTGVTLMKMDEGMDTGPVISVRETDIGAEETAGELSGRLAPLGAELLGADLPRYLAGEIEPTPQDDAAATRAPPLRKEDGLVDWSLTAQRLHDHVRAMTPWPGAFTELAGKRLVIHRSRVAARPGDSAAPGTVLGVEPEGIVAACGEGALVVVEAQVEGRRRLPGAELARGLRTGPGDRLG